MVYLFFLIDIWYLISLDLLIWQVSAICAIDVKRNLLLYSKLAHRRSLSLLGFVRLMPISVISVVFRARGAFPLRVSFCALWWSPTLQGPLSSVDRRGCDFYSPRPLSSGNGFFRTFSPPSSVGTANACGEKEDVTFTSTPPKELGVSAKARGEGCHVHSHFLENVSRESRSIRATGSPPR